MTQVEISSDRFNWISDRVLNLNEDDYNLLTVGDVEEVFGDTFTSMPKNFKGVDLTSFESNPTGLRRDIGEFIEKIENEDKLFCTLAIYYPPGGFIGWHTNASAHMYNAICTFSDTGDSFFEYSTGGEIQRIQDNVGWNVKKSFWGSENQIPHRALSNCNRITLVFSSREERLVDDFILTVS